MRISLISSGYWPRTFGGTETYVGALAGELTRLGHEARISYVAHVSEPGAPDLRVVDYEHRGIPVHAFEQDTARWSLADLYIRDDRELADRFARFLGSTRTEIAHFHTFSSTSVWNQLKVARALGLPTILTYHTPMMTCGRGDLRRHGRQVCDGKMEPRRCGACTQHGHGVPEPVAALWARLPRRVADTVGRLAARGGGASRLRTWLQLPRLNEGRLRRWQEALALVDRFVAPCAWAREVLVINGVPPERIVLSRQGVAAVPAPPTRSAPQAGSAPLRLGYLGRIHPVKGIDVLIRALRRLPASVPVSCAIYGAPAADSVAYMEGLRRLAAGRPEITWMGEVSAEEVPRALASLDALVVPSVWLETGPLVVLEAWSVGTPVIGSDLGGIRELVADGRDGLLFRAGDDAALAEAIARVAADRTVLATLRRGIGPVRTMAHVATEMATLYEALGTAPVPVGTAG